MLTIDGSYGEGGGQILRSSFALSMLTGTPFRIEKIRSAREKPGLMRQHLTAVQAAARVCDAKVEGDAVGSTQLSFTPGKVRGGEYTFSIGTAGSTTLVLQTILLPLLVAEQKSRLILEGGTHNTFAPPFDFFAKAYLPLINRMGPTVRAVLERAGFYPAGGGRIVIDIEPTQRLNGFDLLERGELRSRRARACVAQLTPEIARREVKVFRNRLSWPEETYEVVEITESGGPGNIVLIELEYEHVADVFTGFGEIGRRAEAVAESAVNQYRRYVQSSAPVGEFLTDQLMLPMAVAGQGSFRASHLSRHAQTHVKLISEFLGPTAIRTQDTAGGIVVHCGPAS